MTWTTDARGCPPIFGAAVWIAARLGLAGCAATDCDPTQGGLIQGVRCDASGGFDARIKERQDQQASLLDQQMQLERESQALDAEQPRRDDTIAAKTGRPSEGGARAGGGAAAS